MIDLVLVGIGTGNPEHLTLQAMRELNAADLILIPRKGDDKSELADLRRIICAQVLTNPAIRVAEFDMPRRNTTDPEYHRGVTQWHDAVATVWTDAIRTHLPRGGTVALLVWGDPALYDSTLRIASRLTPVPSVRSIPGIMSLNMLAAAHTITLNAVGAPFLVTTGRQLRDHGWPRGVETLVIMLDGECSFQHVAPDNVTIYWGAYVGMSEQVLLSGPLAQTGPRIVATRAEARARHGWIMDIYLLRRCPPVVKGSQKLR
ncbi:precorrin-6A synthase (deacetylating) [Acetobacter oeni]|uniref:Precorrin-6A synthase [deacetylating] n=1 Tax=Acetobacter oeni TaxID=304077 RepID=A0A511XKP6_9PROT|nr:precorrin-6A synthase (deacetylating) [Acetobacter oeni]MBB3883767.1 precorrin-6A synthase [Acetobacter oeni]NHO19887.1 precorrin-6A synthase (deacetylating) [Acetobacter oeni]GBR10334.1 precorrin-2 methylase [Acetobacter oeni LMG 21952]GEN63522.1 precorrin-6A synthase (deacetylating) [Acetobacter oeni]